MSFEFFDDVATADYIQNSDKRIIAFYDETDMLNVYCRYISGLLTASGFYADSEHDVNVITCNFIESVVNSDTVITLMSDSVIMGDARNVCANILAAEETPPF